MERSPCPMQDGLPYVPPEYFEYDDVIDRHHLWWPKSAYLGRSIVHETFRSLQILRMPREGHIEYHYDFEPPEVPDLDFMVGFVQGAGLNIPRRTITEIRRKERGR